MLAYFIEEIVRLEVYSLDQRLPYYMAYPMPLQYDDERMERRDFEYMKSMYPITVKKILPYVEMECDRMSYAGSMIYDEYPDQLQIRMMCNRIYDKMSEEEKENKQLKELIQVLVFQELHQRRCQYRRERKKYFYR